MDGERYRSEFRGFDLEELLAGIGLEELHDLLARVRARIHIEFGHDPLGTLAKEGNLTHGLRVHRGRVDAEESPLSDDTSRIVEALDADVVEVGGTVHGRAAIGGREHEDARFASMGCDRFAEVGRRSGEIRVRPQDAEAGAGHGTQAVASVVADEVVLPVSEEGEVVVGYPSEHGRGLGGLVHGDTGWRMLLEVVGRLQCLAVHPRPVLDRLAYVAEDAPQRGFDLRGGHPAPADLGVNPRLAYTCPIRGDALQRSGDIALSREDGMDHQS